MAHAHSPPTTRNRTRQTRVAAVAAAAIAILGAHAISERAGATPASAENASPKSALASTPTTSRMTQAEYDAAMSALREKYPHIEHETNEALIGWGGMASWFGQTVIGWGVGAGLDFGLAQLFPGQDTTGQALGEIQASLGALQDDVRDIKSAISQLQESVDRAKFLDAEEENEEFATDIHWQSKLIAEWESGELEVHPDDVNVVVQTSARAIEQIRTGTVAGTTGTLPLLQNLLGYTEPAERWEQLDVYRDGYRATLAVGLVNLKWAAERDPRYEVHLSVAESTAISTVEDFYERGGVAHLQPWQFTQNGGEPASTLHPVGSNWMMASGERPLLEGEDRLETLTTRHQIDSTLHALRDDYLKGAAKAETFEEYLRDLGFGQWLDSNGSAAQFAHVDTLRTLAGYVDGVRRVYVRWDYTRVEGNSISTRSRVSDTHWSTDAQAQAKVAEYRERAMEIAPYTVAVETNAAGWAVTHDQEAIAWATGAVPIELDARDDLDPGWMGPLTIENGSAVGLVGIDGESQAIRSGINLATGSLDHVTFPHPASGYLTLVLGDPVAGGGPLHEGHIVPKGTVTIATPTKSPSGNVIFNPIIPTG